MTPDTYATELESAEEDLIADAQQGNSQAASKLLENYRPAVAEAVRKQVSDPDDADDLTQEILCRIWKSLPKFKYTQKFPAWVFQLTRKEINRWKESHPS